MNESMILFIGQAPSRTASVPWTGRSGANLARLMDISQPEMLKLFEFTNILDKFPGKRSGGDLFPIREAKEAACLMLPKLAGRYVVLLGYHVREAFKPALTRLCMASHHNLRNLHLNPQLIYVIGRPSSFCVVPHPSGCNRWYNDAKNREDASEFLKALVSKQLRDNEKIKARWEEGVRKLREDPPKIYSDTLF